MIRLHEEIKELLQLHNCVVIPEFGGFVARYGPASINFQKHLVSPPEKVVAFNAGLKHNDGLLVNFVASKYRITYDKAEELILNSSARMQLELEKKGILEVPGIGFLKKNSDNLLEFEPRNTGNLLPDAFGLTDIKAVPVVRHKREQKPVKPSPHVRNAMKKRMSNLGVMAVVLVTLLAVNAVFLLYKYNNVQHHLNSTLNHVSRNLQAVNTYMETLFLKDEHATEKAGHVYSPGKSVQNGSDHSIHSGNAGTFTVSTTKLEYTRRSIPALQPVPESTDEKEAGTLSPEISKSTLPNGKYYIIGGSFKSSENAHELISILANNGYSPELLITDFGHFRVSVMQFDNELRALSELKSIQNTIHKSAWILNE